MVITIRHCGKSGTEMHSAIVSGNVTAGEASVGYWPFFSLFLVTVPEAFAKLTRSSFPLCSKVPRVLMPKSKHDLENCLNLP